MDVRYLGFDQHNHERAYRFDVRDKGEAARQLVVTADIALFQTHRIAIQDGPCLCARKLTADLETNAVGAHELTPEDFRLHAEEKAAAEAKRLERHQNAGRRPKTNPLRESAWRRGPV